MVFSFRFASQIVKHVTKVIEVKWSLRNGKYLAEDRGAVVVSNHQSSIDVLGELIDFFSSVFTLAKENIEIIYIYIYRTL